MDGQLEESLRRGLAQSAAGDVVDLGDFTQYLDKSERVIAGVRAWCAINEIAEPPLDWAGLGEFLDRAAAGE